ncbi:Modulator of drug activity B [Raoultella ornithinolytica]|nr:Modulator of drug activity B [Raoultella ornithinolytica]
MPSPIRISSSTAWGVDGVYLPFHKANQFLGMTPLPTFIANDVIKMPDVPRDIAEYRKHLAQIFG